ncbi:MAG: HipA domain-containing protein [Candidatus Protistobacter heckmanni]|nr:HipA domain-containing protein [Candidatus Protistobacter heckmanni]
MLDAAQLLSLAAGAKYEMSGVLALQGVVALSRVKASTRIALFRWTLFNVLIGNGDTHLKKPLPLRRTGGLCTGAPLRSGEHRGMGAP